MLLTECFWIKRLSPTTACQCVQGPGQGAIYNTISHTRRGYRHQNCSRLIILNGYRERATLRTAFSLALNQEGRGREGWAKCTAKANGKSKIIVFAFFIIQRERIDGGRERGRGEQVRVSEDMLREKGGTATVIRKKKIFLLLQEKQFHTERRLFIYSYFLVHWCLVHWLYFYMSYMTWLLTGADATVIWQHLCCKSVSVVVDIWRSLTRAEGSGKYS